MFKKFALVIALILLVMPVVSQQGYVAFLTTAVDVNGGATATNGAEFNSIPVSTLGLDTVILIITFTGDGTVAESDDIDFIFEISWDDATTWTTTDIFEVDCPADSEHASNIVIHPEFWRVRAATHIRLDKIVNNTTSENVTACNAYLVYLN
jgi:hypothetical protein